MGERIAEVKCPHCGEAFKVHDVASESVETDGDKITITKTSTMTSRDRAAFDDVFKSADAVFKSVDGMMVAMGKKLNKLLDK